MRRIFCLPVKKFVPTLVEIRSQKKCTRLITESIHNKKFCNLASLKKLQKQIFLTYSKSKAFNIKYGITQWQYKQNWCNKYKIFSRSFCYIFHCLSSTHFISCTKRYICVPEMQKNDHPFLFYNIKYKIRLRNQLNSLFKFKKIKCVTKPDNEIK